MSTKSTESLKEFDKALSNYAPSIDDFKLAVDKVGLQHGESLVKQIQSNPPYNNITGLLNKSNNVRGGQGFIEFFNEAKSKTGFPYAIPLHDGSGLYGPSKAYITPKKAPYLHFFSGQYGWVKTKKVKGVKAMKWFKKAWTKPENLSNLLKKLTKKSNEMFKV